MRSFLLLLLLSGTAQAARPFISVSVDPSRSRNGEPVLFKIQVRTAETFSPVQQPVTPILSDWTVEQAYVQQAPSVRNLNGRLVYSFQGEFAYVLRPRRKGHLKIPSFVIPIGKDRYPTEALYVDVERLGGPGGSPFAPLPGPRLGQNPHGSPGARPPVFPNGGEDEDFHPNPRESFFIRAEPSKTDVYQGEMIVLDYALYQKNRNIDSPEISKFPDFKGFLKEELIVPKHFNAQPAELDGQVYLRSQLFRYALFPLKSGSLKIEPMAFKAEVVTSPSDLMEQMMRGQMPDPSSMGERIPMTKYSRELKITSRPLPPLPAGMPSFTGGVGEFELELRPPTGTLQAEQPFTLQLTMAGAGNLKVITEPPLKLPPGVETYQSKNEYEFKQDATGSKTFEFLLLPRKPGPLHLEPITFSYFNPQTGKYVALKTQPLDLQIEGGAARPSDGTPPVVSSAPAKGFAPWPQGAQRFTTLDEPSLLGSRFSFIFQGLLYAALGFFFVTKRRDEKRRLHFRAAPWDKTAEEIQSSREWESAALAELLDRWLRQRLQGFLGRSDLSTEASHDDFLEALRARLHPEEHVKLKPLAEMWSRLDVRRFAADAQARQKIAARGELEKVEAIFSPLLKARPARILTSEEDLEEEAD